MKHPRNQYLKKSWNVFRIELIKNEDVPIINTNLIDDNDENFSVTLSILGTNKPIKKRNNGDKKTPKLIALSAYIEKPAP